MTAVRSLKFHWHSKSGEDTMGSRRQRKRMGRPPGSGGPPELVRRHRVVVMLNDGELARLELLAAAKDSPLSTVAYELVARALRD